jgi:hypothetical protein
MFILAAKYIGRERNSMVLSFAFRNEKQHKFSHNYPITNSHFARFFFKEVRYRCKSNNSNIELKVADFGSVVWHKLSSLTLRRERIFSTGWRLNNWNIKFSVIIDRATENCQLKIVIAHFAIKAIKRNEKK